MGYFWEIYNQPAFDFIERVCGVRPPPDGGPPGIIGVVRFDDLFLDVFWTSNYF